MAKKSALEVKRAQLERAARVCRLGSPRVRIRPTFMDCGDSVSLQVRAIGGDREELFLLYPEAARALGEALIRASERCRSNSKHPSVTSENYLDDK